MRALRERPRAIAAGALAALVVLAGAGVGGALIAGDDGGLTAPPRPRLERAERVAVEQARQLRRLERELRVSRRRGATLERRLRSAVRRRRGVSSQLRQTRRALGRARRGP